ncbi:MAG: DUF4105 domain-containing protein [Vulcanimicrobiota bacterium]
MLIRSGTQAKPPIFHSSSPTAGEQHSRDLFEQAEQAPGIYQANPDIWHDGRPWSSRNQPASLISQSADGKKTLGGFRWGWNEIGATADWTPNFQNTTIDPGKLKDVHFYVEHFFPAGHGALVFEFEDGGVVGADGQSTNKMVYSIEARKKEGDDWTWQRGLKKTMGIVEQLMTFDDAKQWVTRRQGASLETRRLALTDEQKQRLLATCLDEALQDRTGEYYHTTRNSCYSGLQKVLNKALPELKIGMMSPLTAGLLMRPEAFLTSAYNTVLKRMGIYSRENSQYYLPDPGLHPDKHAQELTKLTKPSFLGGLGQHPWFAPAMRVTGAAVGGLVGQVLTGNLLGVGVLGYVGQRAGALAGDYVEGKALQTLVNADNRTLPGGH